MLKKIISLMLMTTAFAAAAAVSVSAAEERIVSPVSAIVTIDSERKFYTPYNIDGNNYFKLRDIAYALSGSSKQFDVVWDAATASIHLIGNQAYTPVGGENDREITFYKVEYTAVPTKSNIYLNGEKLEIAAYNIQGNNYFKLRDLGEAPARRNSIKTGKSAVSEFHGRLCFFAEITDQGSIYSFYRSGDS